MFMLGNNRHHRISNALRKQWNKNNDNIIIRFCVNCFFFFVNYKSIIEAVLNWILVILDMYKG